MGRLLAWAVALCVGACSADADRRPARDLCAGLARAETPPLSQALSPIRDRLQHETAVHVLEDGDDAMMFRAWLSEAAERSIDAQYFIFSADNVGLIATDYLLRAAERGVRVRVIVDDLLVSADELDLLALDAHPNLSVRVYNPNVNLGKSLGDKLTNAVTDFRGINQRMHNKTFVVDGRAAITGGRNIADEYFDFDREYNFRDRDALLLGPAVSSIEASFEQFWQHPLTVGVTELLQHDGAVSAARRAAVQRSLGQYACDPQNFWPRVRGQIAELPRRFDELARSPRVQWVPDVRFVSDVPGKNDGKQGLEGGGVTTAELVRLIEQAREEVFIQTPYLVTTGRGRALFAAAVARGVDVTILTNSLASTDNPEAFSGYQRDRSALLATGVHVYEWRPDAAVRRRRMKSALTDAVAEPPVFAVHAKTMVIDRRLLVIGTFNLDPRSANLNTECFTVIPSEAAAAEVLSGLREEVRAENAWRVTASDDPDVHAGLLKRMGAWWRGLIPRSIL